MHQIVYKTVIFQKESSSIPTVASFILAISIFIWYFDVGE